LRRINVGIITSTANDKSEHILTQKEENEAPFVKLKPNKKVSWSFFRRLNMSDAKFQIFIRISILNDENK
jgi:hypothetical protein